MLRIVGRTLLMTLLVSSQIVKAQSTQLTAALMPLPAKMEPGTGDFPVGNGFAIEFQGYQEERLDRAKVRFLGLLSRQTGIPLLREAVLNRSSFVVKIGGASAPVQSVGEDESYHLRITADQVLLEAPNPLGVLHGLQTFLQLVRITPKGFAAPAVTIDDQPRFAWRGLMLDTGRHFMPLPVIYRTLDGMEAVKLNVFHWHLSDDQGFRAESGRYPLLQRKGSDGLFYTREDMRSVVAYARDRGIRVVPEFDMPAHTTAWFVGYPELASGQGPYSIERNWGIFNPAIDPTRDSTYRFIDAFLGEMADLFPDTYFHVGGDECNGKEWDASPRIQQFIREHGLKDNAGLQAYFSSRVQKIVAAHTKIMVGWDEVLGPGTPKDVVIQSWRGPQFVAQAARGGNRALLSAGYYLDLNHSAAEHYLADPEGDGNTALPPEQEKRILGGEATMWSEYVTPETVDSRIWPRAAAIAERLWSPRDTRDVASMYARLAAVSRTLDLYGLEHNRSYDALLSRMTGEANPVPLRVLGDVMQPPRDYAREQQRHYDAFFPLNRLVDAIPPESLRAREFMDMVNRIVHGSASAEDYEQAQEWLALWRDNDSRLQPLLPRSDLTRELIPVSATLHEVAQTGLDAIGYLREHKAAPAEWKTRQIAFLQAAGKPQAALVNMIAPAVEKLVQADAMTSLAMRGVP